MFNTRTEKFLKEAGKAKIPWFEKNKDTYVKEVKAPFQEVLAKIEARFQKKLPHFRFSARSISRPLSNPKNSEIHGPVKSYISCTMGPARTSQFEMPPCFYLMIGLEHNLFGAGLYMPSGPQMKYIRKAIEKDPQSLQKVLTNKKLNQVLSLSSSETMKRPPKDFSVPPKYQHLLMMKSFSISRNFSFKETRSPDFTKKVLEAAELSLPLIHWLEEALKFKPHWRVLQRERNEAHDD